jgi:hypothetical protein
MLEAELDHAAKRLTEAERRLARVAALEEIAKELTAQRDKEWWEKVDAYKTVAMMQQTRVWRFGSFYWRVRDRVLRRN